MKNTQIIASFKKDNQRAIEELYGAFRPKFMNWLKGTYSIGKQEEAGEIYQRSFTVLYLNAQKGKLDAIEATVETYLYGIAKFVVKEWQRDQQSFLEKNAQELVNEKEIVEFNEIFESAKIDDSLVRKMQNGLAELGEPCQQILKLFYWKNYSMEAIARETGYKNEAVAKKKKYSCLKKLKTLMRNE